MTGKPILLLDMDGVVCPGGDNTPLHIWPEDDWIEAEAYAIDGYTWKIRAAEPVIRFLVELDQMKECDIRWHTYWQLSVCNVARAFGLPEFPLQNAQPNGPMRRGHDWKVEAVKFLLEQHHDVIWVDDDANRWVLRADGLRQPHQGQLRTVCPRENEGLERYHMKEILRLLGKEV